MLWVSTWQKKPFRFLILKKPSRFWFSYNERYLEQLLPLKTRTPATLYFEAPSLTLLAAWLPKYLFCIFKATNLAALKSPYRVFGVLVVPRRPFSIKIGSKKDNWPRTRPERINVNTRDCQANIVTLTQGKNSIVDVVVGGESCGEPVLFFPRKGVGQQRI